VAGAQSDRDAQAHGRLGAPAGGQPIQQILRFPRGEANGRFGGFLVRAGQQLPVTVSFFLNFFIYYFLNFCFFSFSFHLPPLFLSTIFSHNLSLSHRPALLTAPAPAPRRPVRTFRQKSGAKFESTASRCEATLLEYNERIRSGGAQQQQEEEDASIAEASSAAGSSAAGGRRASNAMSALTSKFGTTKGAEEAKKKAQEEEDKKVCVCA
jgi:hypothetical protein